MSESAAVYSPTGEGAAPTASVDRLAEILGGNRDAARTMAAAPGAFWEGARNGAAAERRRLRSQLGRLLAAREALRKQGRLLAALNDDDQGEPDPRRRTALLAVHGRFAGVTGELAAEVERLIADAQDALGRIDAAFGADSARRMAEAGAEMARDMTLDRIGVGPDVAARNQSIWGQSGETDPKPRKPKGGEGAKP